MEKEEDTYILRKDVYDKYQQEIEELRDGMYLDGTASHIELTLLLNISSTLGLLSDLMSHEFLEHKEEDFRGDV